MSVYLLDTNILSDMMRNPRGRAAGIFVRKFDEPDTKMLTSIIVACEMRYGAVKKESVPLAERVEQMLASVEVVSLTEGADTTYAILRADLERKGQLIGQNDLLIAAHALTLDAILVTDNIREFKRVKGLRVENWLRA